MAFKFELNLAKDEGIVVDVEINILFKNNPTFEKIAETFKKEGYYKECVQLEDIVLEPNDDFLTAKVYCVNDENKGEILEWPFLKYKIVI